jgi:hypothetical protein
MIEQNITLAELNQILLAAICHEESTLGNCLPISPWAPNLALSWPSAQQAIFANFTSKQKPPMM